MMAAVINPLCVIIQSLHLLKSKLQALYLWREIPPSRRRGNGFAGAQTCRQSIRLRKSKQQGTTHTTRTRLGVRSWLVPPRSRRWVQALINTKLYVFGEVHFAVVLTKCRSGL